MEADIRSSFKIIVFTAPEFTDDEAGKITRLLQADACDRVHIRKPLWDANQVACLISRIPESLHHRLSIHDHFELTQRFPKLGGVHLNSRNPQAPEGISASRSCHSTDELTDAPRYSYITLSPIFDSISKAGYSAAFDLDTLADALAAYNNIIALGGIRPEHFAILKATGFAGAALLGFVWNDFDNALRSLLKHKWLTRDFALQFITDAPDEASTLAQIRAALQGGCRWIQIRMKEASADLLSRTVQHAVSVCNEYNACLIVDDNVDIAARFDIGVHLGKNDMPPAEARQRLGNTAIIGSTCNCADDMRRVTAAGASDYIGLGPYKFTTTKKRLAPILGLEGYRTLLGDTLLHTLPVVAIGGITSSDIPDILQAGADGIALSGAITRAEDPAAATRHIIQTIQNTNR